MELKGVYTALITPLRNGRVDYRELRELLNRQISGGVAGVVPVGTTGESPTLDYEEHLKVIEETVAFVDKRCQVIAGTGANATREALQLTLEAKKLGVDASLQVTPYYNKPTQEGLYRHFSTIADETGLPVVLYNVPGRAGVPIAVETISRLANNPLICAVKEAGGSVDRVSAIRDVCDITVLSGDDSLTLPMLSVGAKGIISVASNLIPAELTEMVNAFFAGNVELASKMHRQYYPLFRDLFIESNPIPIKAALELRGDMQAEYRLPLCEISQAHKETLLNTLKRCGIIKE